MKILSWNVNGIRSNVMPYLEEIKNAYDIICIQETKITPDKCSLIKLDGFKNVWSCSKSTEKARKAYSGTLIMYREHLGDPLNVTTRLSDMPEYYVDEGRFTSLEFERFIIANVYTPNSGTNETFRKTLWDSCMHNWVVDNINKKQLIIVGDFNVIRTADDVWWGQPPLDKDIDVYQNAILQKKASSPGAMVYERRNFKELLSVGLIDIWRTLHPNAKFTGYTWYDMKSKARMKGAGWRIDYILSNINNFDSCEVIETPDKCSDHLPISASFNL